jgi:hypothetical protein
VSTIRLDFDEPIRVDKAHDLHNRVRRTNIAEKFAMHCRDVFSILYAGQRNSGADHVTELATEPFNRGLDNFQTSPRLSCRIASRDRFSIRTERSRACDRDDAPAAHCARNPNFGSKGELPALRLGLLQDGDVGVGALGKEILVISQRPQ